MPLEPEGREQLVGARKHGVVASRDAQGSESEWLHARPRLHELDDDSARVDSDAEAELAVEEVPHSPLHGQPRVERALGVSSSAAGAPNTAMTASPANFSTVPPVSSISSRIAW